MTTIATNQSLLTAASIRPFTNLSRQLGEVIQRRTREFVHLNHQPEISAVKSFSNNRAAVAFTWRFMGKDRKLNQRR
jgi:hypothetical protein